MEENDVELLLKQGLWKTCDGESFINLADFNINKLPLNNVMEFTDVVYLYLNNNKLREIDGKMFSVFPNLCLLDLRYNQLTFFPKEVSNHLTLETILLDNNCITDLPIELGSLPKLKELSTFNNPLEFPRSDVINLGEKKVLYYLRACWELQTKELTTAQFIEIEQKRSRRIPRKKKFKKIESTCEIICRNRKSREIIDQIKASDLMKEIDIKNKKLQKMKDVLTLKEWKERYASYKNLPVIKTLAQPPFGTFEEFNKMPNRNEICNYLNKKMKTNYPKPMRNKIEYLTSELAKIQQVLDQIPPPVIQSKMEEKSYNATMDERIKDINMLREIQKKINNLCLKA